MCNTLVRVDIMHGDEWGWWFKARNCLKIGFSWTTMTHCLDEFMWRGKCIFFKLVLNALISTLEYSGQWTSVDFLSSLFWLWTPWIFSFSFFYFHAFWSILNSYPLLQCLYFLIKLSTLLGKENCLAAAFFRSKFYSVMM